MRSVRSLGEAVQRAFGAAAAALVGLAAMALLVLATLAVTALGVLIAAIALAGRLAPREKAREGGAALLEARRTPDGWVAETAPPAA